ncbi:melanopsin-like [Aplysia californica]|uniref:Melanopsin-like n=1 Tax=Aplysia californica TaxID=6500 RepID=A0ABM0JMG0_APLCA|nr:melanopsin-like [Aplysia californica]
MTDAACVLQAFRSHNVNSQQKGQREIARQARRANTALPDMSPVSLLQSWSVNSFDLSILFVYYGQMFLDISILITTFISVQRCCCVALPLRFKTVFTRKRSVFVLLGIWAYGISSYLPVLVKQRMHWSVDPQTNSSMLVIWRAPGTASALSFMDVVNQTFLGIASEVVVIVCLVVLTLALRSTSQFRRSMMSAATVPGTAKTGSKLSSKEEQVVKTVTVISVVFVCTNSAAVFLAVARLCVPDFDLYRRFHNIFLVSHNTRALVEYAGPFLNFLSYFFANTKFREEFYKLLHCQRQSALSKKNGLT